MKRFPELIFLLLLLIRFSLPVSAQLSPGELSKAHSHLDGLSNCTKCHILGEKETTSKCLECHREIKSLMTQNKGYHASSEVKGKKCATCHGEHFGPNFQVIRFNEKTFNHNLAGYKLEGKHATADCKSCHKESFVTNKISQKKSNSWLGLGTECLNCHDDYHQKTLSSKCTNCHNFGAFKPTSGFNHAKTKFPLVGKHQTVKCDACHKIEIKGSSKFQQFAGVKFDNCTNCHTDVHQNKFGNDCRKCHNEFSFHEVKTTTGFNHNNTDFPLRGSHVNVDCKKCHTKSLTTPLKHSLCSDCHSDYHKGQFLKNGNKPDCEQCHSVEKFSPSLYSIEKHNLSGFRLDGGHLATPCFSCHKKTAEWNFRILGARCTDCHENFHKDYISEKYVPDGNCKTCHTTENWKQVNFDHSNTNFQLLGKHAQNTCRDCHFKQTGENVVQNFRNFQKKCESCHTDIHQKQFELSGQNNCERCHAFNSWKAEKFSHESARFKLDGKHQGVACNKCHKPLDGANGKYFQYKFKDITCAACH